MLAFYLSVKVVCAVAQESYIIEDKLTICVRTDRERGVAKHKVDRYRQGGEGAKKWQKCAETLYRWSYDTKITSLSSHACFHFKKSA